MYTVNIGKIIAGQTGSFVYTYEVRAWSGGEEEICNQGDITEYYIG